jgi:hypothetical protein
MNYYTKGCTPYGADMGRRSDLPRDTKGPLRVCRVPLDEGGYDPGGAYAAPWRSGPRGRRHEQVHVE